MFQIQYGLRDEIFKDLCKQGALIITSDKNKEIVAIITNKKAREFETALIASHGYSIGFLADLPNYIIYPFVSNVMEYRCGKIIKNSIESWTQDWSA